MCRLSMFHLLFLHIIILQYHAADPNPSSIESQLKPSGSLITRWLELYRQIHEPEESQINLVQARAVLREMSAIERTDVYILGLRPLDNLLGYPINHYEDLLNTLYQDGFIEVRDANITQFLLRIFEGDLNNCTKDYFQKLNQVSRKFERFPIVDALRESRELQERDCWSRLIDFMASGAKVIGSADLEPLNELASVAYNNADGLTLTTDWTESNRIDKIIAQFLEGKGYQRNNQRIAFQRLFQLPCKLFVDSTKHVVAQFQAILRTRCPIEDVVTSQHASPLSLYKLCHVIMDESDIIGLNLVQSMGMIEDETEFVADKGNQNKTTNNPGAGVRSNSANLITQHLPADLQNDDLRLEADFQDEPAPKRARIENPLDQATGDQTTGDQASRDSANTKQVVEIIGSSGKGRNISYFTKWSDGSVTVEKKKYLVDNWNSVWNFATRKRQALSQRKYYRPKHSQLDAFDTSQIPLDAQDDQAHRRNSSDMVANRSVIKVERSKKVEGINKFPVIWSDGSKSFETKEFLESHWPEALKELMNRLRESKRKRGNN